MYYAPIIMNNKLDAVVLVAAAAATAPPLDSGAGPPLSSINDEFTFTPTIKGGKLISNK